MNIKRNKRKLVITSLLALVFTAMQVVGYQISMIYGTSVHQSDFFQNINVLSIGQALLLVVVAFPL